MSVAGGAAVAAAVIGTAATPVARADDGSLATDIGLLNSADTNVTEAFDVWTQAYGEAPPNPDALAQFITQTEAIQTPLLSSDNSLLSGFGESLFNGPDQQLAQISQTFLSAAEAYAADPSQANGLDAASASLQFDDSLLTYSLPANVIGEIIDQGLHLGGVDAASASSASVTADDVIAQAVTELNQGPSVLATASTADLGTLAAHILSTQEGLPTGLDQALGTLQSAQDLLNPTDQTLLGYVDEQLVSAAQSILSADQAFVAADQAGELGGSTLNATDLTVLGADLDFLGSFLSTDGLTLLAGLTGGLEPASVADLASSLDPSVFADVLSSIGL
jgi:hypothetical protein